MSYTSAFQGNTIDSLLSTTNNKKETWLVQSDLLNMIYPVGSIYMSMNNVSPQTFLGGTWEKIEGRFLYADATSGSTGGSSSHTHTSAAHTHGLNSHTHTSAAHTHGLNSHTHTSAAHTHGLNSHTHTSAAHTHTTAAVALTVAQLPSHQHEVRVFSSNNTNYTACYTSGLRFDGVTWMNSEFTTAGSVNGDRAGRTVATGSGSTHTHGNTGSTTPGATGKATGNTASTTPDATGAATGNITSTTPGNTGAATGNTTSTTPGATGSTSTMPPYLTVHCWKRTK